MFDIGFAELLVIAVMGLLVLGPEKLPTAARSLGLWIGRIRRSLGSIQREISEELRVDELRRKTAVSKEQLNSELKEMSQPFKKPFDEDSPAQKAAPQAPGSDSSSFSASSSAQSTSSNPSSEPVTSSNPGPKPSTSAEASVETSTK